MPGFFSNLSTTFMLGLLTPLTAVCVLPLYPGFVSFLTSKLAGGTGDQEGKGSRTFQPVALGALVALGVIVFMSLLGLLFTTVLQVSLTRVVGIISPIAFGLLALVSLTLIFNVDFGRFFPQIKSPTAKNPLIHAFLYGLFFGAIVIPCNPGMIAAFFTKTVAMSTSDYFLNILNFIVYGIGVGFPLVVLSFLAAGKSQVIIRFLVKYKSIINRIAGVVMLGISVYYLVFVFHIFG